MCVTQCIFWKIFQTKWKRSGSSNSVSVSRGVGYLPALTVAKTWLSERVAIPSSRHEHSEHSGKKTRVISLFLLSVRWTFFFPENGNWKRGRRSTFEISFSIRSCEISLILWEISFRFLAIRDHHHRVKDHILPGDDFFWWCWFTSYEVSFSPLFLGWLFDQRGRIILDIDPFVISFLYCVSEYQEGAEKELWRWNYVYIYI